MHEFQLLNIDDKIVTSEFIQGTNGTLIMFICNHCPYVKAVIKELVITSEKLKGYGINSVAIMPNDVNNYPEDSFENMKEFSSNNKFNFPYLYDEEQEISKKFGAVCTPDFFGYNTDGELQYRGRLARLNNLEFADDRNDLLDAMIMISQIKEGPKKQYPSAGCSIKWK